MPIIVGTLLVVACASPLLYWLKFDFNPIDLQNPNSEAIATYLELQKRSLDRRQRGTGARPLARAGERGRGKALEAA